jgi:hypothetical protein
MLSEPPLASAVSEVRHLLSPQVHYLQSQQHAKARQLDFLDVKIFYLRVCRCSVARLWLYVFVFVYVQ